MGKGVRCKDRQHELDTVISEPIIMSAEQNSADNYAVLFVGGVDASNNHTRYYNSLKAIYEVITTDYALPSENVYVLYGDKGQDLDKNAQQELYSEISQRPPKEGIKKLQELGASNGFELSLDEAGLLRMALVKRFLKDDQVNKFIGLVNRINGDLKSFRIIAQANPAADKSGINLVNLDFLQKSDLSFADGSRLLSGNGPDLRGALNDLSTHVDSNDHVFLWTFDHGGFGPIEDLTKNMIDSDGNLWSADKSLQGFNWGRRDVGNKSLLNGWGDEIGNIELAQWVAPVIENSGYTTLTYAQCYAGGMIDASRPALTSAANAYGMAAANAYETSKGYSFAEGVRLALQGSTDPKANEVFASAKRSDYYAAPYAYLDNDGMRNGLEHPWALGGSNGDFSVFAVGNREHPLEKEGIDLLESRQFASESTFENRRLMIKEDGSLDISAALVDQFGPDVVVEAVEWPTHGSLEMVDGALTYIPMADYHGNELLLLRWSTPSSTGELLLSVGVQPVNDAPLVSDDFVNMDASKNSVKLSIDSQPGYFGDVDPDGDNLRISSFSLPENGRLKKIGRTGFRYKPNTGFVGTDSFLYQVTDGEAYSVAEVSISVAGGEFSLDPFDGFYKLSSEGVDPIINPLRARDGTLLSDESSERWDVVAAVSGSSTYRLLLQGEGRREGYYRVWSADEFGQLINQPKRWLTADQIQKKAYGSTFLGVVTNPADPSDVFASSGLM